MSDVRDLWQEVKAGGDEERRKLIGLGGRILYGFFVVIGGGLALDLYTRPDSIVLKYFGVAAAFGLVVSDIFWAWATHHSAAGLQRNVARLFWTLGIAIYAFNVVSEYEHYLGQPLSDLLSLWYYSASITTVVVATVGWALYSMTSPEQKMADVSARAKADAVDALMKGIKEPDAETSAAFNLPIVEAAAELARISAAQVVGHVHALANRNGQGGKAEDKHPNS